MTIIQFIVAAITGTSCMTLFSYAVSWVRNKQFREPELLNEMLVRIRLLKFTSSINHPTGWIIHYVIGIMFLLLYYAIAHFTALEMTLSFCLLAGALSGLVGIVAWHTSFRLHPNPPETDLKEFYVQLEIAHIIFGASAYVIVSLFRSWFF